MKTKPYINRTLFALMERRLFQGKVLVLLGPRQSGKTTLIRRLLARPDWADRVLELSGDDPDTAALLENASGNRLRLLLGKHDILFLDEAQRIGNIGLVLKRLVDANSPVQAIVSGSSSLDLANKTAEALTGRKFEWTLLPLSFEERASATSPLEEIRELERRLIFGCYPEIVTHPGDETERLRLLASSYLFRDTLEIGGIRRPDLLVKLLRALALQVGSEASCEELARIVGTDGKTIVRHIDLLERCFIIFTLPSYARNLRTELRKSRKVFFYDNGIRNAILGDFRPLDVRTDVGALWENHLMSERLKWRLVHAPDTRAFFWRTAQQKEIDLVEESAEGLRAFEFKWNPRKRVSMPSSFRSAYPDTAFQTITPDTFDTFLSAPK